MKLLRQILKGASLTTALFVCQACYGTPTWLYDADMNFKVVSAEDGSPIDGVDIYTRVYKADNLDWNMCGCTDEAGRAEVWAGVMEGEDPEFRFQAADAEYAVKDTVIAVTENVVEIKLSKIVE